MTGNADLMIVDGQAPHPNDAVAAIITVNGRYLMQLRDSIPGIFYPGHWGFFGGGIDEGEDDITALRRELVEELGLEIAADQAKRFSSLVFDFGFAGGPDSVVRTFYEVDLPEARLGGLSVREGREMRLLTGEEVLDPARALAPYDAYALWMHVNRQTFRFD